MTSSESEDVATSPAKFHYAVCVNARRLNSFHVILDIERTGNVKNYYESCAKIFENKRDDISEEVESV